MSDSQSDILRQKARDLIQNARKKGADAADVLCSKGVSLSVSWREGKLESLENAEGSDIGLRVFVGKRQAIAATTDHGTSSLEELAQRAVAMAKAAPEDPTCGIAEPDQITRSMPSIEMADDDHMPPDRAIALAKEAEEAALALPGVAQCDSTYAGSSRSEVILAATNGFEGSYSRTHYWIAASVLVGEGTGMDHDNAHETVVFQSDLPSAAAVGEKAAKRALSNLGARCVPTCQATVVFAPRVSHEILGAFADAVNGSAIARGTSFLKEHLGRPVFAPRINVIDDPFRPRALRSKPFDAEGLAPSRRSIVDQGVLQSWFLDLSSARKLGLKSTGHGSRSTSGIPHPSPTNLYIAKGELTPEALIKDIKSGFYVTELMGDGINEVTGDLSQAARGFWIENGVISYPVHGLTIAGNLKDMFLEMSVADDLEFKYSFNAPTMRVEGMTVAGE